MAFYPLKIQEADPYAGDLSILPGYVLLGGNYIIKFDRMVLKYMQVPRTPTHFSLLEAHAKVSFHHFSPLDNDPSSSPWLWINRSHIM